MRTFRLDRMSGLRVTDVPTGPRSTEALPDTLFQGSESDLEVVVQLPAGAVPLLADFAPRSAGPGPANGLVRQTIRVAHFHGLKRIVTGLAGVVTVVRPPEARALTRDWAATGAARYDEAVSGDGGD